MMGTKQRRVPPLANPSLADLVPADHVSRHLERTLEGAGRPDRTVIRGEYPRTADFRASASDPDASLPRHRGGSVDLGYHDHDVVNGGTARIVRAPLVTPAEVMEHQPIRDLLWRVCVRWKLRPRQVTGDTTYGTTEHIVAVDDAGIRAGVDRVMSHRHTSL